MLLAEAELWVTAWMSADGTKNLYLPGQMCTWMACGSVGKLQLHQPQIQAGLSGR